MSLSLLKTVSFGGSKTSLATVGYKLCATDGSEHQARTTVGVHELGGGCYGCNISFDDDWHGSVLWDTGEGSPVYACEQYNCQENSPSQSLNDYKNTEDEIKTAIDNYSNKASYKDKNTEDEIKTAIDNYTNKTSYKASITTLATEINATNNKNDIVEDLDDIKGTSFIKDTHSLTNIEDYVDEIDDATHGLAALKVIFDDIKGASWSTETLKAIYDAVLTAGIKDWTTIEIEQIRDALGVNGAKTTAINGQLQTIPTNPLLTNDVRLDNLDAKVSLAALESSLQLVKTETDKIPAMIVDMILIKDIEEGDWQRVGSQMIFSRKLGGAELFRVNLFKFDGTPATESDEEVTRRVRV